MIGIRRGLHRPIRRHAMGLCVADEVLADGPPVFTVATTIGTHVYNQIRQVAHLRILRLKLFQHGRHHRVYGHIADAVPQHLHFNGLALAFREITEAAQGQVEQQRVPVTPHRITPQAVRTTVKRASQCPETPVRCGGGRDELLLSFSPLRQGQAINGHNQVLVPETILAQIITWSAHKQGVVDNHRLVGHHIRGKRRAGVPGLQGGYVLHHQFAIVRGGLCLRHPSGVDAMQGIHIHAFLPIEGIMLRHRAVYLLEVIGKLFPRQGQFIQVITPGHRLLIEPISVSHQSGKGQYKDGQPDARHPQHPFPQRKFLLG